MPMKTRLRLLGAILLFALLAIAVAVWLWRTGLDLIVLPQGVLGLVTKQDLPAGFAQGNGRLEATEVDVATKIPGRLLEVRVREGDRVAAGQVVAVLDTASLEAQRRQAEAEQRRAEQEREQGLAVGDQRASELDYARRELARLERLASSGKFVAEDQLDQARTKARTAEAALRAARIQVVAAEAAIAAAQASSERVAVDIADSTLRAPPRRAGPLSAGGGRRGPGQWRQGPDPARSHRCLSGDLSAGTGRGSGPPWRRGPDRAGCRPRVRDPRQRFLRCPARPVHPQAGRDPERA